MKKNIIKKIGKIKEKKKKIKKIKTCDLKKHTQTCIILVIYVELKSFTITIRLLL